MCGGKARLIKLFSTGRRLSLMLRPIPRSFAGLRQVQLQGGSLFNGWLSRLCRRGNIRRTLQHCTAREKQQT
jgi:hypothetical protein